jgi:hypothetical protein
MTGPASASARKRASEALSPLSSLLVCARALAASGCRPLRAPGRPSEMLARGAERASAGCASRLGCRSASTASGSRWRMASAPCGARRAGRATPCSTTSTSSSPRPLLFSGESGSQRVESKTPGVGRGQLDEAQALLDPDVVVHDEAGLLVEGLRPVDVGDGNRDQLELEVHPARDPIPARRSTRRSPASSPRTRPAGTR